MKIRRQLKNSQEQKMIIFARSITPSPLAHATKYTLYNRQLKADLTVTFDNFHCTCDITTDNVLHSVILEVLLF